MACLADTSLRTPEAVVLDGANGVTAEPRQHFPHAVLSGSVAALALLAALVLLRTRLNRSVLAAAVVLAAAPGTVVVLALRADSPLERGAMTATLSQSLQTLSTQAPWPDPHLRVAHEDDDVLFPLTRYAVPTRPEAVAPVVELEVRGGSLAARCSVDPVGRRSVCGAGGD